MAKPAPNDQPEEVAGDGDLGRRAEGVGDLPTVGRRRRRREQVLPDVARALGEVRVRGRTAPSGPPTGRPRRRAEIAISTVAVSNRWRRDPWPGAPAAGRAAAPAGRPRGAARAPRRARNAAIDTSAEIVATAHSSSVRRPRMALMVSRPTPRSAPVNSPTRAPRKAAGAATCRPANRYGTARPRPDRGERGEPATAVAGDEVGPRLRARRAARRGAAPASCRRRRARRA